MQKNSNTIFTQSHTLRKTNMRNSWNADTHDKTMGQGRKGKNSADIQGERENKLDIGAYNHKGGMLDR